MDVAEVERWFEAYLADFVAMGRGDLGDVRQMLAHFGAPLLVSSDDGSAVLLDEAQVLAFTQAQADGMRADGYAHSERLSGKTAVVNRTCGTHRGRFARLRADGTAIGQVEATYVITDGPDGRRIRAVLLHADPS